MAKRKVTKKKSIKVKSKKIKVEGIGVELSKDLDKAKDKADVIELNYNIDIGLDKSPDGWKLYKISVEKLIRKGIGCYVYDYITYVLIPHYKQNVDSRDFNDDKFPYLKIGNGITVKGRVDSATLYSNNGEARDKAKGVIKGELFNAITDLLEIEKVYPKDIDFYPESYLEFYRETMFGKDEAKVADNSYKQQCCGGHTE